jgi:hypothetical protein
LPRVGGGAMIAPTKDKIEKQELLEAIRAVLVASDFNVFEIVAFAKELEKVVEKFFEDNLIQSKKRIWRD